MGLLDIFGGSPPQKAQKLKAKVTQRYGDPSARQKAISQLGEMKIPEAAQALMARFTILVEPQSIDAEEKEHVFELLKGMGEDAVAPVTDFLKRSDSASSWALRILSAVLPEERVLDIVTGYLRQLSNEYTRDPEKKIVLLGWLEGKSDPRVGEVAIPFLQDSFDDVKLVAIKVLASNKHEPAREPLLELLTGEETARRVQTAVLQALADTGLGVQGYREKVEKLATDPYSVDRAGTVKKRA